MESERSARFVDAFRAKYGRTPSACAMQAYDAANGFAATDWHAWEVFNESSGAPYLAARERTLSGYAGPQAGRCKAR